jgi:nitric oxide reductase NorQ protein
MEHILIIPEKKPYIISSVNRERIQLAKKRSDAGKQTNILIKGATGTGKSEMVAQVAADWNRPFCIVPVGGLDSANSIFGRVDLEAGETVYRPGLFLEAIQTENAVIHLEEINRPENDKALNAIFGVLDDTSRSIWIDELQELIHVAPGVTFFASLNEGFEFIGTMPLDVALKNRFAIKMELTILPEYAEAQILAARVDGVDLEAATELVKAVNALRDNPVSPVEVSTRDMLSIAEFMQYGMDFQSAFLTTVDTSSEVLEQVLLLKHMAGEETHGLDTTYTLL